MTSKNSLPQIDIDLAPVTPPPGGVSVIDREEAVQRIKEWFFQNFEDPAQSTPYDSDEGDYAYVYGGPYDAREVIEEHFAGSVSHKVIADAIAEIEKNCLYWAPNEQRIVESKAWLEDYTSDDPYSIFKDTYDQAVDLINEHGGDHGQSMLNRMIFVQLISGLEAYLCDKILYAIGSQSKVRDSLLAQDKEISALRYSLQQIASNENLVSEEIKAFVQKIMFHNLGRVDVLYNHCLGIRLFENHAEASRLYKAIRHRHDCVHRNGIGLNGDRLEVFTKAYVLEIADTLRTMVNRIDNAVDEALDGEELDQFERGF